MGFSRQEYCVGCHFLLQGIFPISWVSCIGTWIRYHWATYHMALMVTQVEKQMKAWGQMTISPLTIGMERQDLVRVRFMRLIEKRKKEREREKRHQWSKRSPSRWLWCMSSICLIYLVSALITSRRVSISCLLPPNPQKNLRFKQSRACTQTLWARSPGRFHNVSFPLPFFSQFPSIYYGKKKWFSTSNPL